MPAHSSSGSWDLSQPQGQSLGHFLLSQRIFKVIPSRFNAFNASFVQRLPDSQLDLNFSPELQGHTPKCLLTTAPGHGHLRMSQTSPLLPSPDGLLPQAPPPQGNGHSLFLAVQGRMPQAFWRSPHPFNRRLFLRVPVTTRLKPRSSLT